MKTIPRKAGVCERTLIIVILTLLLAACTGNARQQPEPGAEPQSESSQGSVNRTDQPKPQVENRSLDVGRPALLGPLEQVAFAGRLTEPGAYLLDLESEDLWQFGSGTYTALGVGPDSMLRLGKEGLDLIDLPSKQATRLLHDPVYEAAWAPETSQLAFTIGTGNQTRVLYVATFEQAAGRLTSVRPVGPGGRISRLQWSPNGESLVWLHAPPDDARQQKAYRFDVADNLLVDLGEAHAASWSGDNRTVAVSTAAGLYLHDGETRTLKPSTASLPGRGYVLWGPGEMILYGPPLPGLHQSHLLVAASPGGQGLRTLAVSFGPPQWSPRGERFAYVSDGCTSGEWNLYVMTKDPASRTRLTDTGGEIKSGLLWSPDGSMIAFSGGRLRLKLADIGSGAVKTLAQMDGAAFGPLVPHAWSADGRYLVFSVSRGGRGVC